MPSTASRARGATSIPPPPSSITRSRDRRRPTLPRGSARIPIGRWPTTQGDRFEPAFLAAIDRAMAFAPDDRPQSVEEWSALFGVSLPKVQDAPTQRLAYAAGVAPPRLGGASREGDRARRGTAAAAVEVAAAVVGVARLDDRRRDGRADAVALPAGDPHSAGRHLAGRLVGRPSPPRRPSQRRSPPAPHAARRQPSRQRRPDTAGARYVGAEGDRRAGPACGRRRRGGARACRRGSADRAVDGGRSAHRGGAGGPAGSRARRAAVVRSGARATSARSPTASGRVSASPTSPMANARPATGRPIS